MKALDFTYKLSAWSESGKYYIFHEQISFYLIFAMYCFTGFKT